MPSYNNFRNDYKRSVEGANQFKNPKVMIKQSDISEERKKRLVDWITFYRRNVHRFVEHYFGIKLYPYQIIWLYMMSVSDSFVAICSRAVGKTWLLGVMACARAVLYPNSEIVVVSSTKEQAGILVSDKITSLRNDYPNLAREISNIVTNMNKWQVDFHNGSVIRIVASRDSSRGKRSTFTIYEEFRLIDKLVLDSVIRPFAYIRQVPYLKKEEYKNYVVLIEEPKEVFISSAYHKGLWWFEETKKNIKSMIKGENSGFIAMDFQVAIRHRIKTLRQIKNEISKMDEITALEEYYNIPWGESSDAYFRLKMFERARTIKKAFYPQRMETYNPKKNPYGILKLPGELRVVTCDTAQRAGRANDLSITACLRLLPTHKGFFRELVYMESFSGVDSITQSLRMKQVYFDFDADALVLDVAAGGGGLPIYDQLGILTKDAERGIEYPPMTIINHSSIDNSEYEELLKRTLGVDAKPVIYPISANAKLNSLLAVEMRDKLQKRMFGLLVDEVVAEDYLIRNNKEFMKIDDINAKSFFTMPHVQVSLFINECVGLSMSMLSGNLRLVEPPGSRKDRYVAIAMGNYYASLLDQELLRINSDTTDLEALMSVTFIN